MARSGKLAAVAVAKAKGPAVLFDGGGLYLRVSGSGAKSWVFRYQLDGKRRDMGIGPFPQISLAEARGNAAAQRKAVGEGKDPLGEKAALRASQRLSAAKGRTFREAAEEFIARNEAGWRNEKHRQQWRNTLATYVYPVIGELPVAAIDAGLVVQVLEPLWTEKPETASRVRGRIEAVLGIAARALEFAIFTAARTGEVLGARWGEIDLAAKVWTVPGERMKAGKEHRVPLSDPALAVLESVRPLAMMTDGKPDPAAPVFPGPRRALPLSNMTMLMLLRRMKRADLTAHGFRSTFGDWAAERTAYPREVVEMALAHAVENKVEAAYRRGDLFEKRRKLMEAWARFCKSPPTGAVVPLRAGA
jgi:integrase